MIQKLIIVTTLCSFVFSPCIQSVQNQSTVEIKIDHIFQGFQKEKFVESKDLTETSGWMMELPSGKSVSRSFLMNQAEPIITLGKEAIPALFKWVMNDQLYIRYIAIYSLQEITGLSPFTAYFDKEDSAGNREKAIKTWNEWYEGAKIKE
jgi:hypothetical protein